MHTMDDLARWAYNCKHSDELAMEIDDLQTKLDLYERLDDISDSGLSEEQCLEYTELQRKLCKLRIRKARENEKINEFQSQQLNAD